MPPKWQFTVSSLWQPLLSIIAHVSLPNPEALAPILLSPYSGKAPCDISVPKKGGTWPALKSQLHPVVLFLTCCQPLKASHADLRTGGIGRSSENLINASPEL